MKTTFAIEKILVDRLKWQARTECLSCGEPVVVTRGEMTPVLRAAREVVGVACADCLDPESRATLAALRGEAKL